MVDPGEFSAADVCAIARISHRKLDHWLRSGIVDLPDRRNVGSGYHRRFSCVEADAIRRIADEKRSLDRRLSEWASGALWHDLTGQRVA